MVALARGSAGHASCRSPPQARRSGTTRPAARHLADLGDGAARLAAAVRDLPQDRWSARVEGMRPPEHPAWYLLVRRLREIGLHHVDLAAGYGPADWPAPFVLRELHDCRACRPHARGTVSEIMLKNPSGEITARWPGLGPGPTAEGAPPDMLAWPTGRSRGEGVTLVPVGQSFTPAGEGLPEPPPWLTMPAPADLPTTPPKDYP
ncbi:maleylpyruvate isomerase N-terminal domain-containing protein [Nonomuraea sp. NPDC003707]